MEALPQAVWRMKGWLSFKDTPDAVELLQRVGPRWQITVAPVAAHTARRSELVVIGASAGFDAETVRRLLHGALAN